MPTNTKHTAPASAGAAVSIKSFNELTNFLHIQNTDAAIAIRAGFKAADLLTDGFRILPGQTWIVPTANGTGGIFIISEDTVLTDKIILVQG